MYERVLVVSRRRAVVAFGATVFAAPFSVLARQQVKVRRIGLLVSTTRKNAESAPSIRSFLKGLRELGYIEGRNVRIDWRFANDVPERLPELAEQLAKLPVDVIATYGTTNVRAAQRATKTIPIVAMTFGDPVGSGFAASLSHPGGNITGLSVVTEEIDGKRLELLSSLVPKSVPIAYLLNPESFAGSAVAQRTKASAGRAGIRLLFVEARTMDEIAHSFFSMIKQSAGALLIQNDVYFNLHALEIGELATRHKLPSCSAVAEGADGGALMSFGVDLPDMLHRAATYVDKILKGEKPGDIPIEQASKFEFVVNLKTARALGVIIPQSMLIRADRVIE